jgi:RNA polymerase sigma factor (sigma-70 family)
MTIKRDSKQEDALLESAIRGDRTGLEYLVNAYKDLAYAVALKIVLNNEDAEEVVQDSFVKAFAALKKFKRVSKFSTWLYRIVYNTALTKKADKKNVAMVGLDKAFEYDSATSLIGEGVNLLKRAERKKYIDLALNKLTKEDYLIVSFYYIGEKNISEICNILDLKQSAVKMRLARSRKQLQHELERLLNNEIKSLL